MNNYNVSQISSKETYQWLLNIHYAKRIPNIMFAYGLYNLNELVGIVTYGKPASNSLCIGVCGKENSKYVIELNRLCLKYNKKNEASFLVSNSLKLLPKPKIIVSYADTKQIHVGYVYQATNFFYTGLSAKRTDVDTGNKHGRHYSKVLDKTKRVARSQKHRYIIFVGNKRQKKYLLNNLRYKIQQYPKGDTEYYKIDKKIYSQLSLINTNSGS
jgi:hypothetical protein